MSKVKYFPHLAGTLILSSAAAVGLLNKWEPSKGKEGAELIVYADKLAKGLPTVCNGITKHVATIPVLVGDVWTQEMCEQQSTQALLKIQNTLATCFETLPPQSVFDAATSHAWNLGVNKTCTSEAMKQWNRKRWVLGCELIAHEYDGTTPNWSYSNGKFVQGLYNRRLDEVNVCKAGA